MPAFARKDLLRATWFALQIAGLGMSVSAAPAPGPVAPQVPAPAQQPTLAELASVIATIRNVPGVMGTHDLHVWTVGPGAVACCVHVLVAEQTVREGQQISRVIVERLEHDHRINHATIQVEVECHEGKEMYCSIAGSNHVGYHH